MTTKHVVAEDGSWEKWFQNGDLGFGIVKKALLTLGMKIQALSKKNAGT